MGPKATPLANYLRARREQVRPEDVGLSRGARRRVAGLRREELATLAGISSAYYLRLEQGRDTHPSAQVVDALARALQLDVLATEYLHRLASAAGSRGPDSSVETVASGLLQLIDQLPLPAFVANWYLDTLAANRCARALSPGFIPGRNFLRWLFCDPAARRLYGNWDEATELLVSESRDVAGSDTGDPRWRALIDELSAASRLFRELWARADVGYRTSIIHMRHPQVGDLHLHRNRLAVPHSGGQQLLIYHAQPGSESATALEELRSLSISFASEC